jgi:predicted ATPase
MTPFVGREQELSWLQEHLVASRNNNASLILLDGEVGIGKTRLVEEMLTRYCSSWMVLKGACQQVEQRVHAYAACIEALRSGLKEEDFSALNISPVWVRAVARFLPDLALFETGTSDVQAVEPTVLADAVVALFNDLAHPQRPLILVLDDLHWADDATLALLGHLARHVQCKNVVLLGTTCSGLAKKRLVPLRESAQHQHVLAELQLGPLCEEHIAGLATAFLTQHHARQNIEDSNYVGHWCYQRSEGNPFLATAYLQHLVESRAARHHSFSVSLVPPAVQAYVQAQIERLSPDALALLTVAAACGVSFDIRAAVRATGMDKRAAVTALQELLQQALLVENSSLQAGFYAFTHAMVREVVLTTTKDIRSLLLDPHEEAPSADQYPASERTAGL